MAAALALVFVLGACSDELISQDSGGGAELDVYWSQYDFVIGTDDGAADTRVSYVTDTRSLFEEGDEVGVYAVDNGGNLIPGQPTNVKYAVRDVTNIASGEQRQVLMPVNPGIRVDKDESYRYVLYYPYNVNMTLDRLKNYTHTVRTDQNSADAYEASDLLWCYYDNPLAASEAYEVYFDHAMAQIIVELDEDAVYVSGDAATPSGVYLLNMPTQGTGINLVQSLDNLEYDTDAPDPTSEDNPAIHAWDFGLATTGQKQFRAVVPAHTIRPGVNVVRVYTDGNGNYTDYKLKSELPLQPGYNYRFTLSKGSSNVGIEVDDDDSWVLDVLDPETGEPVGLLCREYLRFQPNDGGLERHTGDDGYNTDGTKTRWINSQAWVFYNFRGDSDTPDLSRGTVLRFTYDVQKNLNYSGYQHDDLGSTLAYMPAPHENTDVGGIFLPKHGFYWTTSNQYDKLLDGKYGTELNVADETDVRFKEQNYHMHGGEIIWGYANGHSYISEFRLPKAGQYDTAVEWEGAEIGDGSGFITNKQASLFGHIAISDGKVEVSYAPISADDPHKDLNNCKVGILQPHFLIDSRVNLDGEIEVNKYPLVKIGHNQFWMSKPLQTKVFTDGTPLMCCNKVTTDGSKPATTADGLDWNGELGPSYMYPFSQSIGYDPVNDPTEMTPPEIEYNGNYAPALCYNSVAVNDERFVPVSNDSRLYYQMPTKTQFEDMSEYFDDHFAGKIATNQIVKRVNDNFVSEDGTAVSYFATRYGKTYGDGQANYYTANVSGLNLRALGSFYVHSSAGTEFNNLTRNAVLILKNENSSQTGVDYMEIHGYSPFESGDFSNCIKENEYKLETSNHPTHFFAQVRMVMKFRNQLDNGGSAPSLSTRSASSARRKAAGGRSVRVELVP